MEKEKEPVLEMRMDSVTVPEGRYSTEGYFYDTPILTRTGIFEYKQSDGSIRRELRRPEDVFDPESLASYEGKPIIITHRAQEVNTDNIHREEIGCILTPGWREGDTVRAKIVIHDPDAVKASGYRELSLGYHLALKELPGELEGKPYDAIQTGIRVNHLALVAAARAGDDTRLHMDSKDTDGGNDPMDEIKTTPTAQANQDPEKKPDTTATDENDVGATPPAGNPGPGPGPGEARKLDEEGLKAALAAYLAATTSKKDSADTTTDPTVNTDSCRKDEGTGDDALKAIVARRDLMEDGQAKSDINTLLSMLEAATARADVAQEAAKPASADPATMNHDGADDIDAKVRQRVELIRLGDRLNLDGMDTMPVDEAKKKVIVTVLPGMHLDGKTSAYIDAAYDMARDQATARRTVDEQRQQLFRADAANAATNRHDKKNNPDDARNRMIQRNAGCKEVN